MRFVLRNDNGENFNLESEQISAYSGIEVLDIIPSKAILIEASENAINELRVSFPGWTIDKEVKYKKP